MLYYRKVYASLCPKRKERNVPQNEIAFFNKDQSKTKINMKRTVKISD